jgi:hypothetical protein
MKNNLKMVALSTLVLLASCSKDSDSSTNEQDQAIQEMESTPLEANSVSENVIINGGTQNDGVPPTPNEAITLDVSNSSSTAFLGEGFEISLDSDASITGAYLQFKSNDGTVADSYYDINLAANNSGKKAIASVFNKKKKGFAAKNKEDEETLDVDFNAEIEPGTFCYVICVYDAQGNISAPQEVCVTVEAWGGNSDLVANWELTKEEETFNGETGTFVVGTPDCSGGSSFRCNETQEQISVDLCYTQEYGKIEFKSDGTFVVDFKAITEDLDDEASNNSCMAEKEEEVYRFEVDGYWAYVADEGRLTMVGYSWSFEEDGEIYEETFNSGEGELVFDGTAKVDGNVMTIEESYDDNDDGIVDESYKLYFEK